MPNNDTDYKLAELKSILPDADLEMLLEVIVSCNGNLISAKQILGISSQTNSTPNHTETKSTPLTAKPRNQITLKRFLESPENHPTFKRERLTTKGKPLHLFDPADVKNLLPCTMHLNVFPKEMADSILQLLLTESETWPSNNFRLFDRAVSSPHSTAFYTDNDEIFKQKSASYNGKRLKNPRRFSPEMIKAKRIVEHIVNQEIQARGLMPYQYPHKWHTDAAICNKYNGPKQSVGFHSDQLTHIGPHAVIASISLGVTREFRLKSRVDKNACPISVHLPHNSLIIMHAGCQEQYKHSLMPAPIGEPLDAHPVSGLVRINITYRMYLPEFRYDKIPRCECDRGMILRVITKDKVLVPNNSGGKGKEGTNNLPTYIWMCGSSYTEANQTCAKTISPKFPLNETSDFAYSGDEP